MIFRSYDIRGIYPSEVNEKLAYNIGRNFVSLLKAKEVIVGRDARDSSIKLFKALAEGITYQGAKVIDIGLCCTPMFYYVSGKNKASIMITASHLPQKYNGFKLCREKAQVLSKEEIKKVMAVNIPKNVAGKKGKIIKKDFLKDFIDFNLKFLKKNGHSLKIVFDAGNGMGGYTIPKIFRRIKNIKLIELYTDLDFSFPNHFPNPLKYETLRDLQKKVMKEKADFGFATDGDADRVILVDNKGEIVSSDILVALLSEQFNGKIVYDLRSSKIVAETILANGGIPIRSKVGHSCINALMRTEKAIFGGELSGHLYFKKNNYAESAFIPVALVMNMLSNGKSLSEILKPFRKYYSSGELNFTAKESKFKGIEAHYKKEAQKIDHLDGLTIFFNRWWFNLRRSNTEDLLRLNLEADTKELMERKKKELVSLLK